jgi:GT2 family glycosyltransferase
MIEKLSPIATVVITTRNRKEMLRKAMESALLQKGNVEVIVMDDASTDGSADMVLREFPMVRLFTTSHRCGLIVQRNRAAELATAPVIFSLDDDAIFTTSNIVEQTLSYFEEPRVGAVALPLVNIIDGVKQEFFAGRPSEKGQFWITHAFPGGASAVRRELFIYLGGFHGYLFQWGEEAEYAQRMLSAGRVVRLGMTDPIHHFPAKGGRHTRGKNIWLYRNMILTVWYNAPRVLLFPLIGIQTIRCLGNVCIKPQQIPIAIEGLIRGYIGCIKEFKARRPISFRTFKLFVEINRRRFVLFDHIKDRLPAMATLNPAQVSGK